MNDELIDEDRIPLSRRSLLPGTGFFYPDSLDEERAERRAREALDGAEVVVVADTDADGLGCVALLREAYGAALDVDDFEEAIEDRLEDDGPAGSGAAGESESADAETTTDPETAEPDVSAAEATPAEPEAESAEADEAAVDGAEEPGSPVALVGAGPHNLDEALGRVAGYAPPDAEVYVCDLAPDEYGRVGPNLESVIADAAGVRWFDHHQWDEEVAAAVREVGADLVVGDSDEECTADVALRSLDYEFPDRFRELAAVTRDHDLWIKEDPRSDDLADYARWASDEEYVTVVGAHGPDLPDAVREFLERRRVEKRRFVEKAVERAEVREIGPWTVGVTYGRCSQNEVAEALRERGTDAAVIVKPAGSASIRGTESFRRCHEVAAQVNGGGHPQAAGCKPDVYDDMLDYAHHWTTRGATAKRMILAAFERVAAEVEAETEADPDREPVAADDRDDLNDEAGTRADADADGGE